MAAIGWYGPLIDLSKASSHVGDYVQLLVFVHKSTPIQYKLSKNRGGAGAGREVIRMDIQVGDETRPYFPVSVWQKQLGSTIVAGDIVLLQNLKIARFRDVIEARTVHCSSLQCLVHSKDLLLDSSKAVDELMIKASCCRIGIVAKDKLNKVIAWLQRAHLNSEFNRHENINNKQILTNWKMHEEIQSQKCASLMQLKCLRDASKATFYASVGEIFLPITWRDLQIESEAEKMFVSRRIYMVGEDDNLVDDFISTGCELCGSPLSSNSNFGSGIKSNIFPPLCEKSSNGGLHVIGMIYRRFMLYVWDHSHCVPLLVRNKAAEKLFGSIRAKNVYSCYELQKRRQNMNRPKANYYSIWLLLLKMLLKQGKNSPSKFSVKVNSSEEDGESGRYELVSVSMS